MKSVKVVILLTCLGGFKSYKVIKNDIRLMWCYKEGVNYMFLKLQIGRVRSHNE